MYKQSVDGTHKAILPVHPQAADNAEIAHLARFLEHFSAAVEENEMCDGARESQ